MSEQQQQHVSPAAPCGDAPVPAPPPPARSPAEELYEAVRAHAGAADLELEMRLCYFDVPLRADLAGPAVLQHGATRGRVDVGVSAADFARIREHVLTLADAEGAEVTRAESEDINSGGVRHSYLVRDDGTYEWQLAVHKERLYTGDVARPGARYDLRLSALREVPVGDAATAEPPAERPRGYTRRKWRTRATLGGSYCYDLTEVRVAGAAEATSYEVEIEAALADPAAELTLEWVRELVRRMEELADLDGNTGKDRAAGRRPPGGHGRDGGRGGGGRGGRGGRGGWRGGGRGRGEGRGRGGGGDGGGGRGGGGDAPSPQQLGAKRPREE